jgi:hypothetical protein
MWPHLLPASKRQPLNPFRMRKRLVRITVRYPFALRAERNGTNASDVRYPDAADPLYLLYLWTLGRRFLHSHLSPAYPVIPSWTHVMTFLQPRFVVIGTWHVYKPSYISPQSLVK